MVDWGAVIGECLTQVLRILLPLSIAVIIKWAVELYQRVKTDHADWAPVLSYAAELAVLAAEQIFGAGRGSEKKRYAIETIQRMLAENGMQLDIQVIEDAIEAEVYKWLPHDTEQDSGPKEAKS